LANFGGNHAGLRLVEIADMESDGTALYTALDQFRHARVWRRPPITFAEIRIPWAATSSAVGDQSSSEPPQGLLSTVQMKRILVSLVWLGELAYLAPGRIENTICSTIGGDEGLIKERRRSARESSWFCKKQ
jgi:hypothetical protein